jgi:methylthioribose-1-phosphate isomerase
MKIRDRNRTSIWANEDSRTFSIIDQTLLPFVLEDREIVSLEQAADAIRSMRVRGAPLIGVTACFGIALAMQRDCTNAALAETCALLQATRPTAVNLGWALERMTRVLKRLEEPERADAKAIADEDSATNEAIGKNGLKLIAECHEKTGKTVNILTHCNAGALACVDWGTATAPIYMSHAAGIPVHVWVEETRPRNQGLLTAWEFREAGVAHTYIVDNAGGHMMQQDKVDLVIVGADRVSRLGDVANKIGTYLKALAAHDCGVPFYAALPSSTIDWQLNDAMHEIDIEERSADEIRLMRGLSTDGMLRDFRVLDEASAVSNPGFDVTPARLVTGIITERGVNAPAELATAFNK